MKNLKVLFTVLCVACATAVWGESEQITLANGAGSGSGTSYQITWSGTSCTITQTKAKSSTNVNSSYISAPRWYQGHKIIFTSKSGYTIKGATIVCTSNSYANALKSSTYSTGVSANVSSSTVTITSSGDFEITMGAQSRISSVTVIYTSGSGETTPSITQHPKSATYDQGATPAALTITASGNPTPTYQWYSNTSNNNSNGTKISGATEASYTPSTASTGTFYYYCVATNSQGSASSHVATITVNTVPTYTVQWKVGGNEYTEGDPTTSVKSGEQVSTLPTAPADDAIAPCANTFMGWSTHNLGSETRQGDPGDLFTTIEGSPVITKNTTFYAVFATKKEGN